MRLTKHIIPIVILFGTISLHAQTGFNNSQWNRYMLTHNVAYAGYYDYLTVGLMHRTQWVGWDGPSYEILEVQTPLTKLSNAVGISYYYEHYPERFGKHAVKGSYAYIINNGSFKTAFGLGLGISHYKTEMVNIRDSEDFLFNEEIKSSVIPQASFGFAIYNKTFHVGFSIPEFIGAKFSDGARKMDFAPKDLTYNLMGGYNYALSSEITILANGLVTYSLNNVFQFDIKANAMFNQTILAGLGYRYEEAIYLTLGYHLNRQLSFAYSYDYLSSSLNSLGGSHIIGLVYNLNYLVKTSNPRNF